MRCEPQISKVSLGYFFRGSSDFEWWHLRAIAEEESGEMTGGPVTGEEAAWVGKSAPEPSEPESINPDGDVDLVASEETDGFAYSVNGRRVREVLLNVVAERLLHSASEADEDVAGTGALKKCNKRGVLRCAGVDGRDVEIFIGEFYSQLMEPASIPFGALARRHDPASCAGSAEVWLLKKRTKIFEAGELVDPFFTGEEAQVSKVPKQDHVSAVGDDEVGREESLTICGISGECVERRASRDNNKASSVTEAIDGFVSRSDEEIESENLLKARLVHSRASEYSHDYLEATPASICCSIHS